MDGEKHEIPDKWDLIIAHPPCTKTSNAGAKHLYRGHKLNIPRYYEGLCGKALFLAIWKSDCERVVIENPVPSAIFDFPKPTQTIQPYEFGHPVSKKTLLWERGVPPLKPTDVIEPKENCHEAGTWFMKGGRDRQKNRSRTFEGIGRAMAEQWGDFLRVGRRISPCGRNDRAGNADGPGNPAPTVRRGLRGKCGIVFSEVSKWENWNRSFRFWRSGLSCCRLQSG
jgi:hypothetical protein